MPFPWKKARTNRLSQIVADLQSPKRGGSLVVETGFPTSLVDLFVKHRDRLKKPSTRKKSKKKKSKLEIHNNSPISQQSSPRSIVDSCENPIIILEEAEVIGDCGSELVPDSSEINVVGVKNMNENRLFVILSKVFVVAILASSTKKLVIGITLSAFTLLLLEFVVGFLKPCSNCNHLGIDKILVSEQEHEHEEEEDEEVSEREGNLGSMILVLIVLAGLFGGRFMAVIITIGGCFLFKLIEKIKVRSFKMPLTR